MEFPFPFLSGQQLPEVVPPPVQRSRQGDRRILGRKSKLGARRKSENTRVVLSSGRFNLLTCYA
jgi:hypothetical protein